MNIRYLSLVLLFLSAGTTICSKQTTNTSEPESEACEQAPTSWKEIGIYRPDKQVYTGKSDIIGFGLNFFYDNAYVYLPEDEIHAARVKLSSGKLKKKTVKFDDTMFNPEVKIPTVWHRAKNGPQYDDCGSFVVAVEFNSNDIDKSVKITQNDSPIASFVCEKPSQLVLNDNCFACAGSSKKREAIIIDAKTDEYITITDNLKPLESPDVAPTVQYNNGLVFIQWPQTIYCVDHATGKYATYNSAHTIKTMQVSPDNKYVVICEEEPVKKSDTDFKLVYQLFAIGNSKPVEPTSIEAQPEQTQTVVEQPKKKKTGLAVLFGFCANIGKKKK